MSTVTVVDPATEQEVASYPEHGPEQIEAAVAAADAAFANGAAVPSRSAARC